MDAQGSDDSDWGKSGAEVVWEESPETYSELGLTVTNLMEAYNEGYAMWD